MSSNVGRLVVDTLTNKSGGAVAYGDVVVLDSSNDSAFTTDTSGAYTGIVGVCIEPNGIANNASGRIQTAGPVAQINCSASVTRGHYLKTHTVAKQAADAGTSRVVGAFAKTKTTSATPSAILFGFPDAAAASAAQGTPGVTLGTSNVAGSSGAYVGTDATILAFDATSPSTQALGDAAAVGVATVAARRDHKHAMPAVGVVMSQLGTTSTGGSFRSPSSTSYWKKITMASAGFLASISVAVKGDGSNEGALAVAVASDTSGSPINIIADTGHQRKLSDGSMVGNVRLNTTTRFVTVPVGVWLTAGDYWIGALIFGTAGSLQIAYAAGTGSDKTNVGDRAIDSSLNGYSTTTDDHSIYATILR